MRLDHLLSNGAKETKLRQSFQSLKKTEVKPLTVKEAACKRWCEHFLSLLSC